jgi:hypothetical protein
VLNGEYILLEVSIFPLADLGERFLVSWTSAVDEAKMAVKHSYIIEVEDAVHTNSRYIRYTSFPGSGLVRLFLLHFPLPEAAFSLVLFPMRFWHSFEQYCTNLHRLHLESFTIVSSFLQKSQTPPFFGPSALAAFFTSSRHEQGIPLARYLISPSRV